MCHKRDDVSLYSLSYSPKKSAILIKIQTSKDDILLNTKLIFPGRLSQRLYMKHIITYECKYRFMFSVYPRQLTYTGTFTWKPLLEGVIFALINSSLYEYSLYSNEFVVVSWNICLYVHTHISSLLCLNLAVWVVHCGHILICTIHLMYTYAQNISLIWITS